MLGVRLAEPDDAVGIARVHVRSWQLGYRELLPDSYLDALRVEDRAAAYRFGGEEAPTTLVTEQDGVIRGFATARRAEDVGDQRVGELLALYVDPDGWGRGVGRRLLHAVRKELADRGHAEAILWVLVGNDRADRFYGVDGWVLDRGRRRD